jgi:organic hydroperoxide reductase OsmC/OhrA
MSTHTAHVAWQRNADEPFVDNRYHRAHHWRFDGGAVVPASSSPQVVKAPLSDPSAVDPEEAFVAALASCHLLWFLNLAALDGWCVDTYDDDALGHMRPGPDGRPWIAEVVLRPRVVWSGERLPDAATEAALHHRAHEACFLARSVKSEVRVEMRRSA